MADRRLRHRAVDGTVDLTLAAQRGAAASTRSHDATSPSCACALAHVANSSTPRARVADCGDSSAVAKSGCSCAQRALIARMRAPRDCAVARAAASAALSYAMRAPARRNANESPRAVIESPRLAHAARSRSGRALPSAQTVRSGCAHARSCIEP